MKNLIDQCYQEYSVWHLNVFGELPTFLLQNEIKVPKRDENGRWKPEKPEGELLSREMDDIVIHQELYNLYRSVRFMPMVINRKDLMVRLEALVDKQQGINQEKNNDFYFSIEENNDIYFILGHAESKYNDYTVAFKNATGEIVLLDEQHIYPYYNNLKSFLGDFHDD